MGNRRYTLFRLRALANAFPAIERLPYAHKVILENLLRCENGTSVNAEDIEIIASGPAKDASPRDIAFTPGRVVHQDFTGVPALADLVAMRDAIQRLGGDPSLVNTIQPVDLVIDHSLQVDEFGTREAFGINSTVEFARNSERYRFLRWGQQSFKNFRVVPPQTGIVHQVNLEYLAHVVMVSDGDTHPIAYPDTVVGTDSHTTMINGLGVLGWGCGGIEAEAVMLGQPVSMLVPDVIGVNLSGELAAGASATDLVLTVTQRLRAYGVVGKFVEFFGDGLSSLSVADRATIANMAPEYGATCGLFPIDEATLRFLQLSGRRKEHVDLVEAYAKEQGMFYHPEADRAEYADVLTIDLAEIEASVAGPARPQDRVALTDLPTSFVGVLPALRNDGTTDEPDDAPTQPDSGVRVRQVPVTIHGDEHVVGDGSVVIAAITSCTNTSNPALVLAAGLLSKKALAKGLTAKPWVKTSFAPGSKVASQYLEKAGLMSALEELGFFLVGYGCTTCVGNSGPLPVPVSAAIRDRGLVVASVLSGNRNFEGRVHPEVRANYLASPALVVAYALAGTVNVDLTSEPLGRDAEGQPVYLRDIWPTRREIAQLIDEHLSPEMFRSVYSDVFAGDERWRTMDVTTSDVYDWQERSTYIKRPPYFDDMGNAPPSAVDIRGARVLALLGDSITTDHISPAGPIARDSPAGAYLMELGIAAENFNAYGARRGNHEVMVRGAFANVRLRNRLAPGTEGGFTRHWPSGKTMSIFDASVRYRAEQTPLIIIGGKQYGTGSSRDWAAKGPLLLGVRAVLAESFERIHRSNLVGMGIAPLEFAPGQGAESLGIRGDEVYEVIGFAEAIAGGFANGRELMVRALRADGSSDEFPVTVRIDTPQELLYYQHGGILQYVIRQFLTRDREATACGV